MSPYENQDPSTSVLQGLADKFKENPGSVDELTLLEDQAPTEMTTGPLTGQDAAGNEMAPEPVFINVDKQANVQLAPSCEDQALTEGVHNAGMLTFHIPDEVTQRAGFFVDNPGAFVAQFRQFKFVVPKGSGTPSVQI